MGNAWTLVAVSASCIQSKHSMNAEQLSFSFPQLDAKDTAPEVLAAAYWSTLMRFREEQYSIPSEPYERYKRYHQDYRLRIRGIVGRLLQLPGKPCPEVCFCLGDAYQAGNGITKNRETAQRWFTRAARAGHIKAMVRCGLMAGHPDCPEDHAASIRWFRSAARLGSASAMVFLGFAYREGQGVSQDYQKAVKWFKKAVDAGDSHALVHVGRMYRSFSRSPKKAIRWFLRAADAGHKESFVELAILYDQRGTSVYDPAEAIKWYKIVLERYTGSRTRALLALSHHCRTGTGTEKDLKMAQDWLRKLFFEPHYPKV